MIHRSLPLVCGFKIQAFTSLHKLCLGLLAPIYSRSASDGSPHPGQQANLAFLPTLSLLHLHILPEGPPIKTGAKKFDPALKEHGMEAHRVPYADHSSLVVGPSPPRFLKRMLAKFEADAFFGIRTCADSTVCSWAARPSPVSIMPKSSTWSLLCNI